MILIIIISNNDIIKFEKCYCDTFWLFFVLSKCGFFNFKKISCKIYAVIDCLNFSFLPQSYTCFVKEYSGYKIIIYSWFVYNISQVTDLAPYLFQNNKKQKSHDTARIASCLKSLLRCSLNKNWFPCIKF